MRSHIVKLSPIALFITGLFISLQCSAQEIDIKDYRMLYSFNTYKQSDDTRTLEFSMRARNKKNRREFIPIYKAEIDFVNFLDDQEVLLGSSMTDEEGKSKLTLPKNQTYLTDNEGYINIKAQFKGSDALKKTSREVQVKDLHIDLQLIQIDSVRTVQVKAFTLDSINNKINVEGLDVRIAVNSMLSLMTLDEARIEDGEYLFDFPTDIPGDAEGNITVHTIVEDHDDFANVNQKKTVNWGVKKEILSENNKLWSSAAPYWMYIVLSIMLLGVWANYAYTIINLIKLKKEGEKPEYN